MSSSITLVVAPNGSALAQDELATVASPKLLWTLAGVAAALVRPMLEKPAETSKVSTTLVRSDDVAIIWQVGPWILHGSDLRAGTLEQYLEIVKTARARGAIASTLGVGTPRYAMSGFACDEGIPVGFIVQFAGDEAPLPMVHFPLPRDVQTMWLVAVRLALAARLGEVGLQLALAAAAQERARHPDFARAFEPSMAMLAKDHGIAGDEAVAAMILDGWEREGGGAAAIEAFTSMLSR